MNNWQTCRSALRLVSCCGVKSLGHDLISKGFGFVFCLENCQGGLFLSLACCMNQKSLIIIHVLAFSQHIWRKSIEAGIKTCLCAMSHVKEIIQVSFFCVNSLANLFLTPLIRPLIDSWTDLSICKTTFLSKLLSLAFLTIIALPIIFAFIFKGMHITHSICNS